MQALYTYIRLRWEFVYLAVILDAYSRRVVGWALEDTLEGKLTIAALRMALQRRRPGAGLLHHSDRGVQYAANGYVDLLTRISILTLVRRQYTPALPRIPRLSALNPAHHLRR